MILENSTELITFGIFVCVQIWIHPKLQINQLGIMSEQYKEYTTQIFFVKFNPKI